MGDNILGMYLGKGAMASVVCDPGDKKPVTLGSQLMTADTAFLGLTQMALISSYLLVTCYTHRYICL